MIWWIWILAGVVFAALEILVGGELWLLLIGIAAFGTGMLAAVGLPGPELQILTFAVLLGSAFLVRRRLTPKTRPRVVQGAAALVGEIGTVTRTVGPARSGQVEVRGSTWPALAAEGPDIAPGAGVRVAAVVGIRLRVRPLASETPSPSPNRTAPQDASS